MRIKNCVNDTSAASMLMALSGQPIKEDIGSITAMRTFERVEASALQEANMMMERIRMEISSVLTDEEDFEADQTATMKEKSSNCTTNELISMRRERNKLHAKRTRLRKKKMQQQMETVSSDRCTFHDH
jgi:nanoRNase/pAp phosphatase (c-di-AMP/oligoRNAs hydrolase)